MNFEYIKQYPGFDKLYGFCKDAEDMALSKPILSVTASRQAMEFIVKMIYRSVVDNNYGLSVFEMITDVRFTEYVNDNSIINSIHYIRKMGNLAVHEGIANQNDSVQVLETLHYLIGDFFVLLGLISDFAPFQKPTETTSTAPVSIPVNNPQNKPAEVEVPTELIAQYGNRMAQTRFDVKYKRDENKNKELYLYACFREANLPVVNIPNQSMPCSVGRDIVLDDGDVVDFVIYGQDNKPLAIINHKLTLENIVAGRNKVIEQANKLEIKYGYKPIAYYSTGYYIYVIDQLGYPPRRVFQYHTIKELERIKQRANLRKDISNPVIDDNITNRDYQKDAIRAACNAFSNNRRRSLLVMATGTGKTRISISLVDILMKAGWVNNVLFLADRTSLVRQAHKNFNKLLPSITTSVYSGSSFARDPNARVIFSTYQTMINLIDDDTREFGIGRFDLIIIDEAHRSIFKKYKALFNYFDAMMVGLTATPRSEDNKNTYEMFNLANGEPDFAYELEQAIDDRYLVGFSVLDKTTDALRRGIHYDDLTPEEREQFEDTYASGDDFEDGDLTGAEITPHDLQMAKTINLGTIDVMLNDLMANGLKINGGDKIGKTIIFAASHLEAEKIVERFYVLYPHLGQDFCKLIDSKIENCLSLIDNFGERDQMPQIAVSVDMMDTGIDVPDVLNLVFFKKVGSKIKFLQMIGRGTRLSPDIYGPGYDKQGFLIFDYFDNFNYFRTRNTWTTANDKEPGRSVNTTPQSELINRRRLNILRNLIESNALTTFDVNYRDELKQYFINSVRGLNNDALMVQYNMSWVSKYRTAEEWDGFTDTKIDEICQHIIPLIPPEKGNSRVKTFDLMIYVIEENVPKLLEENQDIRKIRFGFGKVDKKIDKMMSELTKLKTIPDVMRKEQLITDMRNADYVFVNFSYETCEYVRKELRDLMQYIPDDKEYYIVDTKDFIIDTNNPSSFEPEKTYLEKVREYLNNGSVALSKIRNLDALTDEDKYELEDAFLRRLGTDSDYNNWSNGKELFAFLRVQVGISDVAIQTKFGSFLNSDVLDTQQLQFMNQILEYVKVNGDISVLDLQRVSPFCDVNIIEMFGAEKMNYIKTLINGLQLPIR